MTVPCSVSSRVSNTATLKQAFQDFVQLYIKRPAQAAKIYPEMSAFMKNEYKGAFPKTSADIDAAAKSYADWYQNADPLDQIKAGIFFDRPDSWLNWFKEKASDVFNKENFEKNFISKLAPLRKISPEAEFLAEIYKGAPEAALQYTKEGRYEYNEKGRRNIKTGKSLDEIVKPILDNYEDASAYLVARTRSEDLGNKDKKYQTVKSKANKTKEDLKYLKEVENKDGSYDKKTDSANYKRDIDAISMAEAKHPEFKKFGQEFSEFMSDNLKFALDAQLITKESYNSMINARDMYAPLYRVIEGSQGHALGTTRGMSVKDATKARTNVESAYDIIDPIQTGYNNAAYIIAMSERNAVLRTIAQSAKGTASQHLFEEVTTPKQSKADLLDSIKKQGLPIEYFENLPTEVLEVLMENPILQDKSTINVFENGVKKTFDVDPVIYEAIKGIGSTQEAGWIHSLLSAPATALRFGATVTPAYTIKAFVKDIPHALVTSQYGLNLPDIGRGVFSAFKKDAWYQEFARSGGAYSSASTLTRKAWSENIDQMKKAKDRGYFKKLIVDNKLGLSKLQEWNHALENAPRVAEFRKAIEAGATRQEAAHAARNITLDFQRRGAIIEVVNQLVPFSNAFVQGQVQFLKFLKPKKSASGEYTYEDTAKPYLRGLAYMGVPAILNAVMNADNEKIKSSPEWERQSFYQIDTAPFYETEKEKRNAPVIKIPKTQEFGAIIGNAIEACVDFIYNKDPKAFKEYANHVLAEQAPTRLLYPTAVLPAVENFANKAIFFNSPIVPLDREGLLPAEQYSSRTGQTFKSASNLLAKIFGDENTFSPAMAENYIDKWTGTLGRDLLKLVDKGVEAYQGKEDVFFGDMQLTDTYILKSFLAKYPTAGSPAIRDFFENYKSADTVLKTVRKLAKEGKGQEARELYSRFNKIKQTKTYKGVTKMLQFMKKVKQSDMPTEQKNQLIEQTMLQINEVATRANAVMDLKAKKV